MDGEASGRLTPETSPAQRHLAAEPEVVESVADMRAKIEALRSAHAAALAESLLLEVEVHNKHGTS